MGMLIKPVSILLIGIDKSMLVKYLKNINNMLKKLNSY